MNMFLKSFIALLLAFLVSCSTNYLPIEGSRTPSSQVDPLSTHWDSYVAGSIDDIQNPAIKKFIVDSQRNNAFGLKEAKKVEKMLGPFAPTKGNVFWLPHIEMPLTEENWRYLASHSNVPSYLQDEILFEKNGEKYMRFFIHPFSTKRDQFVDFAKENGGFKYSYQAATTASTRSFVAWKAKGTLGDTEVTVPTDASKIFKPKVSIYNTNIHGSRLNPPKKMVRAAVVSQLLSSVQGKYNTFFEGEYLVGVPDGTSAGTVIREASEYSRGVVKDRFVEPAFATLSPDNLQKLFGSESKPLEKITKDLFKPVGVSFANFLLNEGAIGEMHTQNFNFVVDAKGVPTGEITVHDADAFRINLALRALNGKDISAASNIEDPHFFLKEAAFGVTQDKKLSKMTLNSLTDYLLYPYSKSDWSMVSFVYNWCKEVQKYASWCSKDNIRKRFLKDLAEEFSTILERKVEPSELDYNFRHKGKKGMISLFEERINQLAKRQSSEPVDEGIQEILKKKFDEMVDTGYAKVYGNKNYLNIDDSIYYLNNNNGSFSITVMKKNPRGNPLLAMAVVAGDQSAGAAFLDAVAKNSQFSNGLKGCNRLVGSFFDGVTHTMRKLGDTPAARRKAKLRRAQ